ncbi:MAG: RIP metalloprotease [Candidatus Melainabacteria bacterium]|nr:MAG: RIP metalloprotease [Candidatus Melainabacteria bacterium]
MKLRLLRHLPSAMAFAWMGGIESVERAVVSMGGGVPAYAAIWFGCMMVITFHELAHWSVARRCGMQTPVFSVGFGSLKYSFVLGTWKETQWRIGWFPFGGFVSIPELADESITFGEFEGLKVFPLWQRALVALAGPAANVISAFILLFGLYAYYGQPLKELRSVVDELSDVPSIARNSGIMINDRIVSVGGTSVTDPLALRSVMERYKGAPVTIMLDRGGISVPALVIPDSDGHIGMRTSPIIERVFYRRPLGETLSLAWEKTEETFFKTFEGLGMAFHLVKKPDSLKASDIEVRGIIYMAQQGAAAYESGMFNYGWSLFVISMGLGLINLAPVPVLDGGHLIFYLLEAVRGKPLAAPKRILAQKIGAGLMVCFMLYGFCNDIKHIVMNLIG